MVSMTSSAWTIGCRRTPTEQHCCQGVTSTAFLLLKHGLKMDSLVAIVRRALALHLLSGCRRGLLML